MATHPRELLDRLKADAARRGQTIDEPRFSADADYAENAILRFTDFGDPQSVVQALQWIDALALPPGSASAPARPPLLRRELRPASPAPAPGSRTAADLGVLRS